MTSPNVTQAVRKAKHWLGDQLIAEVPEDLALCEFGCRKQQCRMGKWEQCERRLRYLQGLRKWKASHL